VAVRRVGTRIRVEYLDVRAVISALPHARVGFVVPKYGHSSVERNRLKRRLRELVRTRLLPALRVAPGVEGSPDSTEPEAETPRERREAQDATSVAATPAATSRPIPPGKPLTLPPIDVVVRALPTAYEAPFAALAAQVDRVYAGVRQRVLRSDE